MRFYEIDITDAKTGQPIATSANGGKHVLPSFSSLNPNGSFNPGALNVEIDCVVGPFGVPYGGSGNTSCLIQVWGISLQDIQQSNNLSHKQIIVKAGMSKGLPLASQAVALNEQGIIVQGNIFQGFGNWIGTAQTLSLDIRTETGNINLPASVVFDWKAGTPLQAALTKTLNKAFPSYSLKFNISPKLVLGGDEVSYHDSLPGFAQYLNLMTANILNPTTSTQISSPSGYRGVDIIVSQKTILITDFTTAPTPKQLAFTDMIGQATWTGPQTININVVMRGDLTIGDYVKLPPGQIVTTTTQSLPSFKQSSIFQGIWQINSMRHIGDFREPAGESWITNMFCSPAGAALPS